MAGETAAVEQPAWWQQTIDFVIKSAAVKQFQTPQLQSGLMYQLDQNGNPVAIGQVHPYGTTVAQVTSNPLVLLVGVALVGLLIFKVAD